MSLGLLLHADEQVAGRLFAAYNWPVLKYERCLGLVDPEGGLHGVLLFHNYNGSNVELSYYGAKTLTVGILRTLARFIVVTFDPSRLTVVVSKRQRPLLQSLQKLGFKLEGAQRCYYGKHDTLRNTGVRLVMFRERLDELAYPAAMKAGKAC